MEKLKVKDLIKRLKEVDPELPIIYSADDEGNMFNYSYMLPTLGFFSDGEFIGKQSATPEDRNHFKEEVLCIN